MLPCLWGLWAIFSIYIVLYDIKYLKTPPFACALFFMWGVIYVYWANTPFQQVIISLGIVFTCCVLLWFYFPKALGMADLKLLCGAALFLPPLEIPYLFLWAGTLGLLWHSIISTSQKRIPFVFCIMAALHLCMLRSSETFI